MVTLPGSEDTGLMNMNALPSLPWLVADIGGTNARFARVPEADAAPQAVQVLRCNDYPDPAGAIEAYLASTDGARPRAAVLAVAAPVLGDLVKMTNNHWRFSIEDLRHRLGLEKLRVLNDFTALALALPHLGPDGLRQVSAGQPGVRAPLALLGPGTGLGVSGLLPVGDHSWLPLTGEGGHVTLAAGNEREAAVIGEIRRDFPHVSAERVLSGSGLVNLYRGIARLDGYQAEALDPAEITRRALDGQCPLCLETLTLFCALLGTVGGDLVLTLGAHGGVYIGGGIVPRLGEFFERSPFHHNFTAKGRFANYLSRIPCHVVTASTPALLGTARAFTTLPD
jgi:glucokinase